MTLSELRETLRMGRIPQAAIITGSNKAGQLEAAKLAGMAAVCSGDSPPCGLCRDCRKAERGIHPDITVVEKSPDRKILSVDEVRAVRSAAFVMPNEAARSVFILKDADAMNAQAQNALLKVLEEPPPTAVFLLLADNAELFLPTIRSRCAFISLASQDTEESEDAMATAERIFRAYSLNRNRELLEAVMPLEKKKRDEMAEIIEALRRVAVRNAESVDAEVFDRLCGTLDTADKYMDVNVSVGHIVGLVLAELLR